MNKIKSQDMCNINYISTKELSAQLDRYEFGQKLIPITQKAISKIFTNASSYIEEAWQKTCEQSPPLYDENILLDLFSTEIANILTRTISEVYNEETTKESK